MVLITLPPHSRIYAAVTCPMLSAPDNGMVNVPNRLFRSVATYECIGRFTLIGNEERECLITGEWSGEPPVCECMYVNLGISDDL